MEKFTKKNLTIFIALFAVCFRGLALDDQKISTFEPGATGEIGFSSYTVKNTSFFSVQPQVAANTLTTGINGSANCFSMTTANNSVRYQTLSFMNLATSITPAMMSVRKYLKIMVKRDYDGNNLNILANGTVSNWNTTNFKLYTAKPAINTWVDVVIDLSALKGTALWKDSTITNFMIEPVENNSVSLGFPVTVALDNIVLSDNATPRSPAISTSASNVYSHSYVYSEGPSSEKSFTVSGTTLLGDITLTPTTPYEISTTSGSGFTSGSITLSPSSGTLSSTTIYTRLAAGLSAAYYDQKNVAISSSGATTKNVALWGWVNKANQTIAFDSIYTIKADTIDYDPGATSATSAINPITYTSSDLQVATIVNGKIHPVAKGVTQITASQAASSNFNAAVSVIQRLYVIDTSTDFVIPDVKKLTSVSVKNNKICLRAYAGLRVDIFDIQGSKMYSNLFEDSQTSLFSINQKGVYCILCTDKDGNKQISKVLIK